MTAIDPDDSRRAEADENKHRLSLTPTEIAGTAKYFMRQESEAAKERMSEGGKRKGYANFADPEKGSAISKAAAAVGASPETVRKAIKVVDAAEKQPEKYGPVAEEMDRTGKVDPA